jgi:hypothetical protein
MKKLIIKEAKKELKKVLKLFKRDVKALRTLFLGKKKNNKLNKSK